MNLNQVTIPSLDLNRSIPFYEGLGLHLIVHSGPEYARFECPEGDATVSLHRVDELGSGPGVTVYFEHADLDEKVSALITAGYAFDLLPTDQRWSWREAHLRDPDGNKVILYWAGESRKYPPWRIGSKPGT